MSVRVEEEKGKWCSEWESPGRCPLCAGRYFEFRCRGDEDGSIRKAQRFSIGLLAAGGILSAALFLLLCGVDYLHP